MTTLKGNAAVTNPSPSLDAPTAEGTEWVLVPRIPTAAMMEAGATWTDYQPEDDDGNAPNADQHCAKRVYRAMLASSPAPAGGRTATKKMVEAGLKAAMHVAPKRQYTSPEGTALVMALSRDSVEAAINAALALLPALSPDSWIVRAEWREERGTPAAYVNGAFVGRIVADGERWAVRVARGYRGPDDSFPTIDAAKAALIEAVRPKSKEGRE